MNGKKRVLITGGTGYIGTLLVQKLLLDSHIEVCLLTRDKQRVIEIFGASLQYIEIASITKMQKDIQMFQPECVIHLAAYATSLDTQKAVNQLIKANIIFTSNLLLALSDIPIKLFVNAASFSEYHNNASSLSPTYFYSATKSAARGMIEYYAKRDGFRFINTILYSVYGKKGIHKKIMDYAIDALDTTIPVPMSDGQQKLDFVHINDVVDLYIHLVHHSDVLNNHHIDYPVGSGVSYSIREMVSMLETLTEKKANIDWGAYNKRKMDTEIATADIDLTQAELGYTVHYPLKKGLQQYIKDLNVR